MTMTEEVDDFARMFLGPPGQAQREARQQRAKKERRTQLTPKQRKRGGVRTTQVNYRCTPAHQQLSKDVAKAMGCSVADVMEEALLILAAQKGIEAPE